MRQALFGGSAAAVVSALVSLPLHSPSDSLFGTITVVVGSLLAGLAAGTLHMFLARGPNLCKRFSILWLATFGTVVLATVLLGTQIDRMISFGLPLTTITFVLIGASVLAAHRFPLLASWRLASIGLIVALAIGFAFANEGDQKSGRLELPPRSANMTITSRRARFQETEIPQP